MLCLITGITTKSIAQSCDNGNLQAVVISDMDNSQLCFGGFLYRFTIELDLLNGPQGNEYEFVTKGDHLEPETHGFGYDTKEEFFINVSLDFLTGCEPLVCDIYLDVYCEGQDEVIISDIYINTITIYPFLSIERVLPDCTTGESGSVYVVDLDGNICSEILTGTAGSVGVCNGVDGVLPYSFVIHENTPCETTWTNTHTVNCNTGVSGCTDSAACNYDPNAVCDDGSCYTQSQCCPSPINFDLPDYLCSSYTTVCIEFDDNVEGVFCDGFSIGDENNNISNGRDYTAIGNTVCIDIYSNNRTCEIIENVPVSLYVLCKTGNEFFTFDLGLMNIYPSEESYKPLVDLYIYSVCEPFPDVYPNFCPLDLQVEVIPAIEDCQNPTDGNVFWTVTPIFDFSMAPECFSILTDTIDIAPCSLRPENGQLSIKKVGE